jgi:hypothetical protein
METRVTARAIHAKVKKSSGGNVPHVRRFSYRFMRQKPEKMRNELIDPRYPAVIAAVFSAAPRGGRML